MFSMQIKVGKKVKVLYLIICLLCTTNIWAQKLYVVSVGICDYKDPQVNDLRFTESDVESFNKVVKTHTNEVYTLLGSNATHSNVYHYISQVFAKATSNDAVMLFFSGHGYPGGFCCYDMDKTTGGLTYTEISSLFKQCKAKCKMVFADACFSGGLRKQKKGNDTTSSVRNGDVMFFLSSRTNETSQEMIGGPNGQFTRFLVRGLGGGADTNRDKIITAKELYDFVHEGVSVATGNKQHPVMWGRFNNSMTVINWNKK